MEKEFKVEKADENLLDKFYEGSALTIEGLAEESFEDWFAFLKESFKEGIIPTIYKISGELMNNKYSLTGSNRYPEDLILAVINLDDFKSDKMGSIAVQRFQYGGRWFDDIVDNNADRESDDSEE